jgi:hypothetical protein
MTHYDLARFLDLYSSPEVRAHIAAANATTTDHATIRLTEAAHVAISTLERIAENTENDTTERRRAATTLLRALRAPRPTDRPRRIDIADLTTILQSLESPSPESHPLAPPPPPNSNGQTPSQPHTQSNGAIQPGIPPRPAATDTRTRPDQSNPNSRPAPSPDAPPETPDPPSPNISPPDPRPPPTSHAPP